MPNYSDRFQHLPFLYVERAEQHAVQCQDLLRKRLSSLTLTFVGLLVGIIGSNLNARAQIAIAAPIININDEAFGNNATGRTQAGTLDDGWSSSFSDGVFSPDLFQGGGGHSGTKTFTDANGATYQVDWLIGYVDDLGPGTPISSTFISTTTGSVTYAQSNSIQGSAPNPFPAETRLSTGHSAPGLNSVQLDFTSSITPITDFGIFVGDLESRANNGTVGRVLVFDLSGNLIKDEPVIYTGTVLNGTNYSVVEPLNAPTGPANNDSGDWGNNTTTFISVSANQPIGKVVFQTGDDDHTRLNTGRTEQVGLVGFQLPESPTISAALDYGDAPDTYGTDATDAGGEGVGPSHEIVSGLHLGTAPDAEVDAATPLDGRGDDAMGSDEGAITLPTLTEGEMTYTIPATNIAVTNTTTAPATLHAWIDFDKSNTFEPDEYTSVAVSTNSSTPGNDLSWSGITVGAPGNTYARFRLTSDSLTDNNGTPDLDERALGAASDGEVEDYPITIQAASVISFPPGLGLGSSVCSATTPNNAFGNIGIRWEHNDNDGTSPNALIERTDLFSSATPASFVGLTAQINSFDINIDRTTIPANLSLSDYIQYQFTTASLGTTLAEINAAAISLFEKADASDNQASGAYNFAILIDDDPGFNSPAVLLHQVPVDDGDTSAADVVFGPQDFGSALYRLAHYDATGTTVPLQSNTTYTLRVYIYGPTANGEDAGQPFAEVVIWDDFLLKAVSCTSDPNVLLVKRITGVNGQTMNAAINLDIYVDDPTYPYDDNILDTPAPNPLDTENWPSTTGNTNSTFLKGVINGGQIKPGDEIEYTIYFLSAGDAEAVDVQICDRIPNSQTFVPDTFNSFTPAPGGGGGANRGIQVEYNGQTLAYTNDADGDTAQFFPPGATLPPACANLPPQIDTNSNPVDNGTVVVNLGNLPKAESPGSPATSYGFLRFRVNLD